MSRSPLRFSRRTALKSAAALLASATLPGWYLEECAAQTEGAAKDSRRIGLIGCGGRGRWIGKEASEFGTVVALCDVDEGPMAEAQKLWPRADAVKDFRTLCDRQDIDVIVCGSVDHWHTLISIAAMRSGKDVYCEKPLTLTIDEGKHFVKVAQETGRVVQTGSQQRSDKQFRLACELVRNGRIGKLRHVDVFLPEGRREGPFQAGKVPDGFDYDLWLGPSPWTDYVKERTHTTFRYWWEYASGTMTDWGAHHNDIALWGMGLDRSGPVSVKGRGLEEMIPNGFSAYSKYAAEYEYANGVTQSCASTSANNWFGGVVDPKGQQHGVKFLGSDGWIFVSRGILEASDPELLVEPLPTNAERLIVSDNHMGNFFDCVENRETPVCDAEIGHRSASVCHLGVIAMRLGRELKWDPQAEQFVNDAEANEWLAREMRAPWSYDSV